MIFLSKIKNGIIDFLFPKSKAIVRLETLSPASFLEILPPAGKILDKDTIALFDYSHHLVREIVWELKYAGNKKIAAVLGEILREVIISKLKDLVNIDNNKCSNLLLIPVPISNKRLFERGWNQTELLAESIMRSSKNKLFKYLPRKLIKIRHTESQTSTTSKRERLKNLNNSMTVTDKASVSDGIIVVIDDVTTTGATFNEVKRALREAGGQKILCLAVAH